MTGEWTPSLLSLKGITREKISGPGHWEDCSLTSDCLAGASGCGWRCSAPSASAAPAAADALRQGSAGAR